MQKTATFTADEFVRECAISGFLGAYKFWQHVKEHGLPPEAIKNGDTILSSMAKFAYLERNKKTASPQEKEAFAYFGLR